MSELRDYERWHDDYDDPNSTLTWRLAVVQGFIRAFLDERTGPVTVVSSCAGDGRDLLGVLAGRPDSPRVSATLIEVHPAIADAARSVRTGATVEVRTADAGTTDAYRGAVPADLVLLCGIFGNISDADVQRTIAAAPQLCAPGAVVVWTRGRTPEDRNDQVRAWFGEAGFAELDYRALDRGSRPAVGVARYEGPPRPLITGIELFTFLR